MYEQYRNNLMDIGQELIEEITALMARPKAGYMFPDKKDGSRWL
jgi:hypothetical protein